MYIVRIIEGGEIISPEYKTHQEALWHLYNDNDENDNGIDRRRYLEVAKVEPWEGESVPCPHCKNPDGRYVDSERDVGECYSCHKTWII